MGYIKNRLELFKIPQFNWYLLSCFLATTGGGLSYIATTWLVLKDNNSISSVATFMLCFWLPGLLLGPWMGVLVDRYQYRNHLLMACHWSRGITLLVFTGLLYYHQTIDQLYLMGLLLGTCLSIYQPAAFRLTRELVPEEQLVNANTTIDTCFEGGYLIGMALAGIFLTYFSAVTTLLINAITLAASGLALLYIKQSQLTITQNQQVDSSIWNDLRQGLNYILSKRSNVIIYSIQLILYIEYFTAPVILAPFVRNDLHAKAAVFGHIEACLSLGAITGGLFLPWFAHRFGLLKTSLITIILLGLSYAYFGQNRIVWMAELLYFIIGICLAAWPLIISQAQKMTLIDYQGRVQSCFGSISALAIIIIYLLIKLGSQWISISLIYWLELVLSFIAAILLGFIKTDKQ